MSAAEIAAYPPLLINGTLDTTYLGGLGQSDGVYRRIPYGVPKLFYEASNAGHKVWGGPEDANRYVGQLAPAFQKTFLDGDTHWAEFLDRPPLYVATFESAHLPN
ncbi:hypothetical protein [Microbulbifer halophilus]|uniref:Uncharacterized protein n=1 Tax=Microbulbifer halophilus TaxID=453963 RepID=A0ABW5E720_9GAMM|nr:hypothetical protein [Microbulbifer halophilus]MCW8125907.1 hypothetical protein [Microbulbifer halophilus]